MSHLHLPHDHSCGCRVHYENTGREMPQFRCIANHLVGFFLILGRSRHSDEQRLFLDIQVAGTPQLHH